MLRDFLGNLNFVIDYNAIGNVKDLSPKVFSGFGMI
jgi:hypothetical protein